MLVPRRKTDLKMFNVLAFQSGVSRSIRTKFHHDLGGVFPAEKVREYDVINAVLVVRKRIAHPVGDYNDDNIAVACFHAAIDEEVGLGIWDSRDDELGRSNIDRREST